MIDRVKERLSQFGYTVEASEESALEFCLEKVRSKIRNNCNIPDIPDGLCHIAIDMTVGEFLFMKKTFAPDDLKNLDLANAVKQIQTGDTNVTFVEGQSDSDRLDTFINYLLTYGKGQFAHFRRLKW